MVAGTIVKGKSEWEVTPQKEAEGGGYGTEEKMIDSLDGGRDTGACVKVSVDSLDLKTGGFDEFDWSSRRLNLRLPWCLCLMTT